MAKTKKKEIVQESEEKALSPAHLLEIETLQRDVQNAKLLMALEEQSLQNMILTESLLKLKIEKQKTLVQFKAKEHELAKEKYNSLKASMFTEYNLTGDNFGYDTKTGKIV